MPKKDETSIFQPVEVPQAVFKISVNIASLCIFR